VRAVAGHGCTFVRGPPGYALSPGGRATRPSPTERERRGLCGQWHTTHVRDTRAHWVPAPRRPMAGRGDAGRWSGRRRPARMSTALGPVPAWLSPRWRRRSGCPRVSSGHARSRGSRARAAEPARRRCSGAVAGGRSKRCPRQNTVNGRRERSVSSAARASSTTPHARSGPVLCRPSRAQGAPRTFDINDAAVRERDRHRALLVPGNMHVWKPPGDALSPGRPAQDRTATGVRCGDLERPVSDEGPSAYRPDGARTAATEALFRVPTCSAGR
jgi:hypothetical protein